MNLSYKHYSQKLADSYPSISVENYSSSHYKCTNVNETGKLKFSHTDQELHDPLVKDGKQCVFPNVEITLHLFQTLLITNCFAECSLSQHKRIKKSSNNNNASGQTCLTFSTVYRSGYALLSDLMNLHRILQSR